jgi:hypothetical protein
MKRIICKIRIYDLVMAVSRLVRPEVSPEEGTRRFLRPREPAAPAITRAKPDPPGADSIGSETRDR